MSIIITENRKHERKQDRGRKEGWNDSPGFVFTYAYEKGLQWIFPGSPWLSILLAVLTVSPNKQ